MTGPDNRPGTLRTLWRRLRNRAEVFPWMEHTIVVGAAVGAVVAFGIGRAWHFGPASLVFGGASGAFVGAGSGLCLALLWAVESHSDPASSRDLWDPWLDAGNPLAGGDPEPAQTTEAADAETV